MRGSSKAMEEEQDALRELSRRQNRLRIENGQLRDKHEELARARNANEELLQTHRRLRPLREELLLELEEAESIHESRLDSLREERVERYGEVIDSELAEMGDESRSELSQHHWVLQHALAATVQKDVETWMQSEEARAEEANRELLSQAESRFSETRSELTFLRHELEQLQEEQRAEIQALREVQAEERDAEQMTMIQDEMAASEATACSGRAANMDDQEQRLRREVKSLQTELSRATYQVGQQDKQLILKDAEANEVRKSVAVIEGQMDEVNKVLHEQYVSVQQVESSLQGSQEIGPKLKAMREMLQESHEALAQLCRLLESERGERQTCAQGLKQQKVRTELLLHLLKHFNARTQEFSPRRVFRESVAALHVPKRDAEAVAAGFWPAPS